MPQHAGFSPGNWLADCGRCGFTFRASQLLDDGEFPGLKVCHKCWDYKHPQELIQPIVDNTTPDWTQPEPPWVFVNQGSMRMLDQYLSDSLSLG